MNISSSTKAVSAPVAKSQPGSVGAPEEQLPETVPLDSFMETGWGFVDKAKELAPRVAMAPVMAIGSAAPVFGLKMANHHRYLQEGDPNVSSLSKLSTLGTAVTQTAGLALAAASAGSYITGLGDPASLGQMSLTCFCR